MATFYKWKIPRYKCDAATAYKEIHSLDVINSQNIVDLARDENNPLHNDFEWDDAIAGEKYRCEQASKMLQLLIVIDEKITKKPDVEIRAFVSVPEPRAYEPIKVVIQNKDKRDYMLEQAKKELQAFQRKYAILTELEPVFEAIESL